MRGTLDQVTGNFTQALAPFVTRNSSFVIRNLTHALVFWEKRSES
jgi:hypothetical protein